MLAKPRFIRILAYVFLLACIALPGTALADEVPSIVVQTMAHLPWKKVGSGTYRKYGFSVYHATLWAPNGKWNPDKPYALELHYTRGLSQETLADSTIDNIRDENVADEATLARWSEGIKKTMPAVEDGDEMIGVVNPGTDSCLYFNGTQLGKTKDQALIRAFFNIWLGEGAN